jgi:flagellar hook protein FlgE
MGTSASGMAAQANRMSAVADNIANISTAGYKSAQAEFSTLVSEIVTSQYESGAVAAIAKREITQQGSFIHTNSSTDLAINGDGFFVVSGSRGEIALTRSGSFVKDDSGELKNTAGFKLLGYDLMAGTNTNIVNGAANLKPINIEALFPRASASSAGEIHVNLPATSEVVSSIELPSENLMGAKFSAKTSAIAYNNLGGEVVLDIYFSKTADNTWEISAFDRSSSSDGGMFPYSTGPLEVEAIDFNSENGMLSTSSPKAINVSVLNGQVVKIDLSKTVQLESKFEIQNIEVNGNRPTGVNAIQVGADGIMTAIYDDGAKIPIYKIPIGQVASPANLRTLSGNVFIPSLSSGAIQISDATESGAGEIASGTLEQSTVDLAAELSTMIEAQRSYTANSRVFQTGAELMDVIVNLRR